MSPADYLIYRAYTCWLNGEPVDVALYCELIAEDIQPETLARLFTDGCEPPFGRHCLECDVGGLVPPHCLYNQDIEEARVTSVHNDESFDELLKDIIHTEIEEEI